MPVSYYTAIPGRDHEQLHGRSRAGHLPVTRSVRVKRKNLKTLLAIALDKVWSIAKIPCS